MRSAVKCEVGVCDGHLCILYTVYYPKIRTKKARIIGTVKVQSTEYKVLSSVSLFSIHQNHHMNLSPNCKCISFQFLNQTAAPETVRSGKRC